MKSFYFAWKGLVAAFRTQPNFRFHVLAGTGVTGAGIYFDMSQTEWVSLILAITLVIVIELINTSIEFLVNLISPNYRELAGTIKDVSAAAVLVASAGALAVALIIFVPYLGFSG